jgi:hypothetical protein
VQSLCGHDVIAESSAQPRSCQARSRASGRSEADWLDWAEERRTIRHRDGRIGWPQVAQRENLRTNETRGLENRQEVTASDRLRR